MPHFRGYDLNTIPVIVNPSTADALPVQYARFSIPLPKGRYPQQPALAIHDRAGAAVTHQDEVLAHWPDGSVRIIHTTMQARAGWYDVACDEPEISPASALRVNRLGKIVEVHNGLLAVRLGGESLLQSVALEGLKYFVHDGLQLEVEDGQARCFKAQAVSATLETCGPLRCEVVLTGKFHLQGETFLDFRLRVEFLAGVEGFTLAFSFFNLERGKDFHDVNRIALKLKLHQAPTARHSVCQLNHGLFGGQQVLTTGRPVEVVVDDAQSRAYVRDIAAAGDRTVYPFYLSNGAGDVANWAAISADRRRVVMEMDDFHLLRPKTLQLREAQATFEVWPRAAKTLALQQGRSREVKIRVALAGSEVELTPGEADARIAQLRDVWRAQLSHDVYAQSAFFDQSRVPTYNPQTFPRFEGWLERMSSNLHSVARFFDLGDTPDSGYRTTYTPLGRQKRVRGEDGGARWFSSGYGHPALAMNDLEDFEPVWVNNEYDVIYALGTEYLRTGDLTLFQKLRWFARHTVEVDFLHYSDHKWLHRAQPAHSARHTTTGAYPSHFWTQGLAQYYFLTGDPDALEVITALADKTIENLDDPELGAKNRGLNREVGWGVLSLVCAYEAGGDKRYDDYARKILDDILAEGLPHDLPTFSFGHTSMLLAARQYLQVHEGEGDAYFDEIRQWFLSWVELAIACAGQAPACSATRNVKTGTYDYTIRTAARGTLWSGSPRNGIFSAHSLALDCLAYAFEISGDEKYLHAGLRSLEALLDSPNFRTPVAEGKPFAMAYRTWINFLKAAGEKGLLKQWEYRY